VSFARLDPVLADAGADELLGPVTDRREDRPAGTDLFDHGVGDLRHRAREVGGVVGGALGPALAAVALSDIDPAVARRFERLACVFGEVGAELDAVDVLRPTTSLVTAA
jgi:hypothetical protein